MSEYEFSTYHVVNGFIEGEEGVRAIPAGGGDDPPQPDGWYYIVDGMDDGHGPYENELSAIISAAQYLHSVKVGQ